jgi:glyoxylase-like metal-dependent hydrolase (beta-lactamase superfamily II)
MRVAIIPVTPFRQNCSLIWCEASRVGAVVDPGGDIDRIETEIATQRVEVTQILLTHGHLDHAGAAAALSRRLAVPIVGRTATMHFIKHSANKARYGLLDAAAFEPARWLADGDVVRVGDLTLDVIHPGHTGRRVL